MTTFALDYAGGQRRLWLRRRARPLTIDDVPDTWRRPRVAYVGPVAGECNDAFVTGLKAKFVGAGVQGWLRRFGADGRVEPAALAAGHPYGFNVAIISEDDHPDAELVVRPFVDDRGVAAVTRGSRGATLSTARQRIEVPAAPAREVEPTGAGDVFGVVLTLELAGGKSLAEAGRAAAAAAARVVEGPGLGTLPG
jgi:sugar/nucleoside kinase (ribokinase family)